MARFRATIKGQRGDASRLGSAASGISASADGWDIGVEVEGKASDTDDVFEVFATGGSNAQISRRLVAKIEHAPYLPEGRRVTLYGPDGEAIAMYTL